MRQPRHSGDPWRSCRESGCRPTSRACWACADAADGHRGGGAGREPGARCADTGPNCAIDDGCIWRENDAHPGRRRRAQNAAEATAHPSDRYSAGTSLHPQRAKSNGSANRSRRQCGRQRIDIEDPKEQSCPVHRRLRSRQLHTLDQGGCAVADSDNRDPDFGGLRLGHGHSPSDPRCSV